VIKEENTPMSEIKSQRTSMKEKVEMQVQNISGRFIMIGERKVEV